MVDIKAVESFLSGHRIAVVGASDDAKSFGRTIVKELRDHGYDVVAVHSTALSVDGAPCYPTLTAVPGPIDGVMVMVNQDRATDVVHECISLGVPSVWLFKGLGGPGAMSDASAALCRDAGVVVVEGACPLMFLEPVGWFHKAHRSIRRLNGSLPKAS